MNTDAIHKDDSQVCESDCTTPLSFLRKRESSVHKHFMPQAFRNAQSGRSMTEMLGVLAIIGVLSIGGIVGYSYGMDKYRTNQTIQDISLRAVDLMTQAGQGRAELSFAEWEKENTIYDFANPAYSDDGLVMFDVGANDKIPQRVCEMVFDGLSNTAVQIDINAERADSNSTCGTDNTMTFYFEGGSASTPDTGPTGEQCGDTVCGTCQKCDSATETCVMVSNYETKCTVDGQSGWCVSGACEPDTACNCGTGQYCADTNDSCTEPSPSGQCNNLDFRTVDIDGTTYYISNNTMSWWDAQSVCQALGKRMISHTEITQPCKYPDDPECNNSNTKLSSLGKALDEKGWGNRGYPYIWSGILSSSCSAFDITLRNGYLGNYYAFRNKTTYSVVCR